MGVLEESGKRKTKRKNIRAYVLGAVALAGILGIAMVAPNVLGAMAKLGMLPTGRQKEIINRARDRLVRQGLLKREGKFLRLTQKGKAVMRHLEVREFKLARPKRWDGKWRVLIFDIPEYRKGLRDKIRRTLNAIGFVRLQDSVWAYPYDCEDLIAFLKADFRVGKDVLYMIVEELEGDWHLKRRFKDFRPELPALVRRDEWPQMQYNRYACLAHRISNQKKDYGFGITMSRSATIIYKLR